MLSLTCISKWVHSLFILGDKRSDSNQLLYEKDELQNVFIHVLYSVTAGQIRNEQIRSRVLWPNSDYNWCNNKGVQVRQKAYYITKPCYFVYLTKKLIGIRLQSSGFPQLSAYIFTEQYIKTVRDLPLVKRITHYVEQISIKKSCSVSRVVITHCSSDFGANLSGI